MQKSRMTATAMKNRGASSVGVTRLASSKKVVHNFCRRASTTIQVPQTSCVTERPTSKTGPAAAWGEPVAAGTGEPRGVRYAGPRLGSERVCAADELTAKRRSTSRVAARSWTGAEPRAGQARLAVTPYGMKWASGRRNDSQRSGSNSSSAAGPVR